MQKCVYKVIRQLLLFLVLLFFVGIEAVVTSVKIHKPVSISIHALVQNNSPPKATILQPEDDAFSIQGEPIEFIGIGLDQEDGSLSDLALVWHSDKDGFIGTGSYLTRRTLSVQSHLVMLMATDKENATSSAQIRVNILHKPVQITQNQRNAWFPTWSPSGNRILFSSIREGEDEIMTASISGRSVRQITESGGYYPAVSPNGRRIAMTANYNGNEDIFLISFSGVDSFRVTFDTADDLFPYWSPDGRNIAFTSERSGNRDIWIIPAIGGEAVQVTYDESEDLFPTWSPDGNKIAFTSFRTGEAQIWMISLNEGILQQITRDGGRAPSWSPDGRYISYSSEGSVWIIPATGGVPKKITIGKNDDIFPAWSPRGDKIAFSSRASGDYQIWMVEVGDL